MTPAQVQLAHRRLALGILNVGVWVLAATGGLRFLPRAFPSFSNPRCIAFLLFGALGVQALFDYVGGALLMPAPRPSSRRFLESWLRGTVGHALILGVIAVISYGSFRLSGGFVAGLVAATLGLAVGRTGCLRAIGGVRLNRPSVGGESWLADADDPAFTGATIGWGRGTASLWPNSWWQRVPADERAAEEARRRWQVEHRLPSRTLWLVLGWNALGSALGTFFFGLASYPPATALLLHACWMTLWTFGSLLTLPSLSRQAVFAADRAALDAGHDPRGWIARFPTLVGEDGGGRSVFVQTIFYPVPSAKRRLRRLEEGSVSRFVLGNLARANLYYSWAGCTLLGRAVHCDVGRPALWVFPPSA